MRESFSITSVGVVSSLGVGFENFVRGLSASASAFSTTSSVVDPDLQEGLPLAEVRNFDPTAVLGEKGLRNFDRLTIKVRVETV